MKIKKINLVYFSATYTTRKVLRKIAVSFHMEEIHEFDITQKGPANTIQFDAEELVLFGVPVYSGRIPKKAHEMLLQFSGNNTPAVIVCVYGNREYEDALIELKDIVESHGFRIISAGAFIAQHSIFSKVALGRPDEKDLEIIQEFGHKSAELVKRIENIDLLPEIHVKGNHPYREVGASNPTPIVVDESCNSCGTCVDRCPMQAITIQNPRETDYTKCISCGRCIVVCPLSVRHFGGEVFESRAPIFEAALSGRKEPETIFATN